MGRGLNNKEATVIENTIKRLSKMCDSPTLYVGHTNALEWALLMLEDAFEGSQRHFSKIMQARADEVALRWDEAHEKNRELKEHIKGIHEQVKEGDY